ncbi:MAG: VCBS repeat-containing protein [Clostridia bacterium]|nr:VCBS repeat-containing protein [Clostridia bacterium]
MIVKKLIMLVLSALLMIMLSGCDTMMFNADELLLSPMLEGDMYPVQQALEDSVKGKITLRYPVSGEYRSAFVMKDIDENGREEAFAFYSTTTDSTVTMHINVIENEDGEWESKGDLSLVGNGVESVSFADLDGNGNLEIIVGWQVFGNTEKQVGIYTYDGSLLTQRAIEPYTNFAYADLTGDSKQDLVIIYHNSAEKAAAAKLISLSDKGITEVGKAKLDGGVSSYSLPVLSKLTDGTTALYIDAVKGSGMLTEIIWYKDGALHGIYNPDAPESSPTYRNSAIASRDYDSNGVVDIPLLEVLKSTERMDDSDKVYYTNWSEFNGKKLVLRSSCLMNYSDMYSLAIPKNIKQQLLVIRKTETRTRFFYSYDQQKQLAGGELFKIVTVPTVQYNAEVYTKNGYFVLGETETVMYLASVEENNSFKITKEDVLEMFSIIQ